MKGMFIVIEGLDGSGKTTQANFLTKKLEKTHNVLLTAEPSHGKIGTFIREVAYTKKNVCQPKQKPYFSPQTASNILKTKLNPL